jgi:hypothetical protein
LPETTFLNIIFCSLPKFRAQQRQKFWVDVLCLAVELAQPDGLQARRRFAATPISGAFLVSTTSAAQNFN